MSNITNITLAYDDNLQTEANKVLEHDLRGLNMWAMYCQLYYDDKKMLNKGLLTGHVYSLTNRQQLAYWLVLYNLFIENIHHINACVINIPKP